MNLPLTAPASCGPDLWCWFFRASPELPDASGIINMQKNCGVSYRGVPWVAFVTNGHASSDRTWSSWYALGFLQKAVVLPVCSTFTGISKSGPCIFGHTVSEGLGLRNGLVDAEPLVQKC